MGLDYFLAEIRRRRVVRVTIAYCAVAVAVVSVASDFLPALRLPDWTVTAVALAVVLGLPITVVLAWVYDLTPAGITRTEAARAEDEADESPATAGAGTRRGADRALVLGGIGIGVAALVVGMLLRFDAFAFAADGHRGDSIAVLPFASVSGSPDDEVFSAGIHEEVMTQLYRIEGMSVISRTSVMQYRETPKPARIVGQELRVTSVLEASVRRSGERVRIDVRLIDAATDRQLWADSYDRELVDVLSIQADIAAQIASALRVRMSSATRTQLARAGARPVNAAMYETYLRGLHEAAEGRHAAAIEAFRRALEIDPSYAPAHAGVARSWYVLGFFGEVAPGDAFPALYEAAARAVELDPDLPDAHASLALYALHYVWDWKSADERFRHALQLSPNHAQVRHDYAHYLLAMGRTRSSSEESDRAVRLDPGNSMLKACAGWHDFTDREYDNAVAQAMGALMMMPGAWWPEIILGWAYLHLGQTGPALGALRSAVANSNGASFPLASLAHGLAQAGERTSARRMLETLVASRRDRYVSAYDIAVVEAALGERDAAMRWLQQAVTEKSSMLVNIGWDPRFDTVRGEPAFREVLNRMKLPEPPPVKPAAQRRRSGSM